MTTPTRKRKKAAPKTFKAAYDILKTNAAELQQQDEPDIDNLMTTVEDRLPLIAFAKPVSMRYSKH